MLQYNLQHISKERSYLSVFVYCLNTHYFIVRYVGYADNCTMQAVCTC